MNISTDMGIVEWCKAVEAELKQIQTELTDALRERLAKERELLAREYARGWDDAMKKIAQVHPQWDAP